MTQKRHEDAEDEHPHLSQHETGGDGDMNIYFDKVSLLEHLANLEEDNLFKIHLVQEDEQALEALRTEIAETQAAKEREIADVRRNIDMLEQSRAALAAKQAFLESNMKVKQTSGVAQGKAAMDISKLTDPGSPNEEKSALVML